MRRQATRFLLAWVLALPISSPGAKAAGAPIPLCGTVEPAAVLANPAAGRAQLLPVESDYAWGRALLAGRAGPEPAATAAVEATGRFCLAAPAAGLWKVVVEARGFVPMSLAPIPLTGPLELPAVKLQPASWTRVEIRSPGGEPAPRAWVLGKAAEPEFWDRLAGDGWRPETRLGRPTSDGVVRLPRAPGEELALYAFAQGGLGVAGGRGTAGVRLELRPPAWRRAVEVRSEGGERLAEVLVNLAEHGVPVGLTDLDGRLWLAGDTHAGACLILLAADGRRGAAEIGPPTESEEARVLVLPAAEPVGGLVVDADRGQPLGGALVWFDQDAGRFTFSGPRGEYTLATGGRERFRVQARAAGFLPRAVRVRGAGARAGRAPTLALYPVRAGFGRVVDPADRPLAGVEVTLRPSDGGGVAIGTTGADGRFTIAALPGPSLDLEARRSGFAPLMLPEVAVPAGPGPADLGTLVLRPGARIEGQVSDAKGAPLPGAGVWVEEAAARPGWAQMDRLRERPPEAVTDGLGRFALTNLRPGRAVHLLAGREGFLPAWVLGVEAPLAEPVSVVLERACRLAGRVVKESGEAVAGAEVTLWRQGPPPGTVGLEPRRGDGGASTAAGADGGFRFDELAPGAVEVQARAEGYLPGEPIAVQLEPGGEVEGALQVLRQGAVLQGRIRGPRGEPAAGAELRIGTAAGFSDATGSYRLGGVPVGVQALFARHPDYRRRVEEVEVRPGLSQVDLNLEDGWSVSGRTLEASGGPLPGVRVELQAQDLRSPATYDATSGADGRFRVVVSAEGAYRLVATREGFARREVEGLEVRSAPLAEVEVVLDRGAAVGGRLLGLELEDLAAVRVEARREGRPPVAGGADAGLRYHVQPLEPGDWLVVADLDGGRRHAQAAVTVDPGVPRVERDLDFRGGLRLSGRLTYDGEPLAGSHVTLAGRTVSARRAALANHLGSFHFEDLEPGRYRFDVLEPRRALSHVEDLELTGDRELSLELRSWPLTGTVTAADTGEPLEGALVYLRKLLGEAGTEPGPLTTVGTDSRGGFAVGHLSQGRYAVAARKDGYAPAERRVEVGAGSPPPPVELSLGRAGGLTLALRLASGAVPGLAHLGVFDRSGRLLAADTRALSDGGFVHFPQVAPGTWDVLVAAERAAPTWVTVNVPAPTIELILAPAAPLTVRVPALAQSGAAGTLTLAAEDGEAFSQVEPGGALRRQWALAGGVVTLADVPAGVWTVRVEGADGRSWQATAFTVGEAPSQVTIDE